jgi:hypothetical protein
MLTPGHSLHRYKKDVTRDRQFTLNIKNSKYRDWQQIHQTRSFSINTVELDLTRRVQRVFGWCNNENKLACINLLIIPHRQQIYF